MKEELPGGMVYITLDISVSTVFRDELLQVDPEFEALGEKLSQLIAEDFRNELTSTEVSDESPNPTRRQGSNRYH